MLGFGQIPPGPRSTMKTATLTFDVPKDLLASLNLDSDALVQRIRLLAAIAFFQDKRLSLGKAAQFAGVNRLSFMETLSDKGIVVFDYGEAELVSELEGAARLGTLADDSQ